MAPQPTTAGDMLGQEKRLLDRLLVLYTQEQGVYREVLELSRRQGEIVASGGTVEQVRGVLERKNACLEAIRHLEGTEQQAKANWEAGRDGWSAAARARLYQALQEVGQLIEEILLCEEANDRHLLQLTRSD